MASDPVLLEAFRRQARRAAADDPAGPWLVWYIWRDQPGTDRDDLTDAIREITGQDEPPQP